MYVRDYAENTCISLGWCNCCQLCQRNAY